MSKMTIKFHFVYILRNMVNVHFTFIQYYCRYPHTNSATPIGVNFTIFYFHSEINYTPTQKSCSLNTCISIYNCIKYICLYLKMSANKDCFVPLFIKCTRPPFLLVKTRNCFYSPKSSFIISYSIVIKPLDYL